MGKSGRRPQGLFAPKEPEDQSTHYHRLLIGFSGALLPLALLAINHFRPTEGLELDSISAYYYSGAVAIFTGVLFSLAAFLATYRGFRNAGKPYWDRIFSIVAAISAVGVACFPTDALPSAFRPKWWRDWNGDAHYAAAGVLFSCFAVFALWLFPKSKTKDWRISLYRFCGAGILACLIWIFLAKKFFDSPIFWPETIALEFFAVSWLIKGYADWTLAQAMKDPVQHLIGLRAYFFP